MEIMELPLEVLHIILFYAVLGRGIKRALRLRLICKTFASALYPALFETHIMDHYRSNPIGSDVWQTRIQRGAEKLWQEYLAYRVMNERDPTVGRFVEIRQIAQAVCQEKESTLALTATVEALCCLVLTHGTNVGREWKKWWWPLLKGSEERANLGLNTLLSAAAYFDLLPLARRLIAEGDRPTSHNYLFSPPIQLAAQAGHVAMLQLFQEQLPESNFELFSVTGAAIRGDINIVKLALRLPARTEQSDGNGDDMTGRQFGSIKHTSETGKSILIARSYTSSPEVYDYLTKSLAPWPNTLLDAYDDLRKHSELGNLSMVRHLLHLGVPVQLSGWEFETPLVMACGGWHNDVVDLLLEHGADPNFASQKLYPLFPLHVSATASNLSLARTLLDHGALPNRPGGRLSNDKLPVLWWAFAREHTEMIRLLLERGASLDGGLGDLFGKGWVGKSLAEMTYDLGYHSMSVILREYGFKIIGPLPYTLKDAPFWRGWAEFRAVFP
jgi:ankyrin repeat protein